MDRRTKYYRVRKARGLGQYHKTFDAIWEAIPSSVKADCASSTLVALVGAMQQQHQLGAHHATEEILSQGCIYVKGGYWKLGPFVAFSKEA